MSLLTLERVSKRFDGVPAVDEVSFAVDRGQVVGFLGPNGAGKSTTMRMITQYFEPDAGTIRLDGIAAGRGRARGQAADRLPAREQPALRRDAGLRVPGLRGRPAGHPGAGTADAARTRRSRPPGVEQVYHRPIGELSKGFRQRVGLAAAILHRPDLLVLDEPTEGLDPNQRVEIRRLIGRAGPRAHRHPLDPRPARSPVHLLPAADHQSRADRGGRPGGRPGLPRQGRRARQRRGRGHRRRRRTRRSCPASQGRAARVVTATGYG